LTKRYNENPEFKELFDEIIDRPEKVQAATDRFQEAYNKIPLDNKLKLLGEETFKSINPEMFDSINRLSSGGRKRKRNTQLLIYFQDFSMINTEV
jgi:hypothetical protein